MYFYNNYIGLMIDFFNIPLSRGGALDGVVAGVC